MDKQELYLKTLFCCSACDGDIAPEEIELVKNLVSNVDSLSHELAETLLNQYIARINSEGARFLSQYLSEVKNAELTEDEQLKVVELAIIMIEADNIIQYSEVKFFKKLRSRLTLTDSQILQQHPDKEDFLLPDLNVDEDPVLDNIQFDKITLQNIADISIPDNPSVDDSSK